MMLSVKGLTVRLGDKTILEDVSFALQSGEWLMVTGPNGAGKSTLISALAQSVPYQGQVLAEEEDLRRMPAARRARRIGVLGQQSRVGYGFAVEEIVRLGRYAYRHGILGQPDAPGESKVEEALRLTGMAAIRQQNVLTLSGGELQRAFLAQVLAQDPQLLMLDEPSNHLDLRYQKSTFELIDRWRLQPGRAVISVVHDLPIARRFGTRALLLHQGRVAACGAPQQVFSAPVLAQVYGMDVSAWLHSLSAAWEAGAAPVDMPPAPGV